MRKQALSFVLLVAASALLTLTACGCNTEKAYPEKNTTAPANGGGGGSAPAGDRGGGSGGR